MKHPVITNAATAQLPDSAELGKPITIQLAPEGRYPQVVDDDSADGGQREVVQVLDRQAMDTLVANFDKARAEAEAKGQKYGVLVDADHSSETSTNTAAMGWVTRLFVDPEKGLMAEIDPTSEGVEKINGKVYRFVSGAWTLDDDDRPVELVSIGLTNKPNLPVAPMINSAAKNADGTEGAGDGGDAGPQVVTRVDDAPDDTANDADGQGADAGEPEAPPDDAAQNADAGDGEGIETEKETEDMNEIKTLLGLTEEATDEDVVAAVSALVERCSGMEQVTNALGLDETATNEEILEAVNAVVNQCGDLQAKNEEIEKEKLEGEAETLIADNEDVLPEEIREEVKEEYIEDPEKAKETVANYRRIYERAVLNSAKAEPKVRTAVVFRNSEARRPSVGIAGIVADCAGDPVAINAAIAKMYKN
ncbi:MAG: hypothetical protein IIZ06_03695 [Kiritimatiellae bacterium]|nr:hypothetical protein [Kiritimatiellia bacterium]